MQEVWLGANRRALAFGTAPALAATSLGAWVATRFPEAVNWLRSLGGAVALGGIILVAAILGQMRKPRIAYDHGHVLFYLRRGEPIAVPAIVIEAFFLARGPAGLPGPGNQRRSVDLVARLAQRETDWAQRDAKPSRARWQDGHVTIRGAWCEALSEGVVLGLNDRLHRAVCQSDCEGSH